MLITKSLPGCFLWAAIILLCGICPVFSADFKVLPGHVPKVISSLTPKGRLAATNQLWLAIGLPLRDAAGLDGFLAQVYDPASPNFHQFLTPEEFTARFGPTEQDYEAVKNFARANGLAVTGTYGNRLLLDVAGSAAAVEKAFHITLRDLPASDRGAGFFCAGHRADGGRGVAGGGYSGVERFFATAPEVGKEGTWRKPCPKPVLLRTAPAPILAMIFATPMCRARR